MDKFEAYMKEHFPDQHPFSIHTSNMEEVWQHLSAIIAQKDKELTKCRAGSDTKDRRHLDSCKEIKRQKEIVLDKTFAYTKLHKRVDSLEESNDGLVNQYTEELTHSLALQDRVGGLEEAIETATKMLQSYIEDESLPTGFSIHCVRDSLKQALAPQPSEVEG